MLELARRLLRPRNAAAILPLVWLAACGSSAASPDALVSPEARPPDARPPDGDVCADCTFFVGGKVFDGDNLRLVTVAIRAGKIHRLLAPETQITAGTIVDLSGKTLLPGLIDAHVHSSVAAGPYGYMPAAPSYGVNFKAFLRAGVTATLDLGTNARTIFGYRERIRSGGLLAPALHAAGPLLTPSGGHPCTTGSPSMGQCILIDSPADTSKLATDLLAFKPDVMKIVLEAGSGAQPLPRLSIESLAALAKVAQAERLTPVAHVGRAVDVKDALDSGVRHFAHVPYSDLVSPELAARMAKDGAVVIPTLVVLERLMLLAQGKLEVDPAKLGDDVPADAISALLNPAYLAPLQTTSYQAFATQLHDNAVVNFKTLLAAGVTIAAGTDAGNPATFHGLTVPRELELYVEGGMSAREALRAGTRVAAEVLGAKDRGQIREGFVADLLIVEGDPTQSIGDLRRVHAVYRDGKLLDRAALSLKQSTSLVQVAVTGRKLGELCLLDGECAAGLSCDLWRSRCLADCDPKATQESCATDSACVAGLVAGSKGSCLPGDGCDPLKQDCPNKAACLWMGNSATLCWSAGSAVAGQSCAVKSCAAGYQCNYGSSTCYKLCDPTVPLAQSGCGATQSCADLSSYAGLNVGMCK